MTAVRHLNFRASVLQMFDEKFLTPVVLKQASKVHSFPQILKNSSQILTYEKEAI